MKCSCYVDVSWEPYGNTEVRRETDVKCDYCEARSCTQCGQTQRDGDLIQIEDGIQVCADCLVGDE